MTREQQTTTAALQALERLGAQQASAQAHTSRKTEFNLENGQFTLLRTTLDHSLALQAFVDQRRGTVSGNSFEPEAIAAAARDCFAAARDGQSDPAWELAREGGGSFDTGAFTLDRELLFNRTQEMLDAIKAEYPKVVLESVSAQHVAREGSYLNSHGVAYDSRAGSYGVFLMFSGHEGGKSSSFNHSSFECADLSRPFLDQGSLRQNLADAQKQIHTQPTKGKFEGTVVFTPDCLGSMLYELVSNYASDSVLLDGTSLWKDALGTQVADPRLTLSFKPLDPRMVSAERYTQEGFLSRDYDLIERGVLKQFMLSAYAANKTGHSRAPNTSHAIIVAPGQTALKDILSTIDKGLLVSRYSGGASGAGGEFSGVAKNSFLIENGQLGPAVSETMISGNLAGMLNSIRGISRETMEDGSSSLPWLAVDGITISGK